MAKRKRNSEGNELAQGGRLKRVKEQEQIEIKSEAENVGTLPVNANQLNDPGSSQLQGSEDEVALARKIEKHKRRKLKRVRKAALHAQDVVKAEKGDEVVELKHTKIQKSRKRNQILDQQQNGRRNEDQAWEISKPVGGRMTGIDPIFSPDEEYLLIAYDSAIIVYSTATSLPVRSLRVKEADNISAFSLSSHNTQQLYISTTLGMIEKWDWTQGSRLGHWKLSSSIYFLTTSVQAAGEAGRDLVYTVDRKGSNPWLISVHHLTDSSRNEVKTLFSSDKALSYMKVMEGGRFIIATSGARLIIGSSSPPDPAILQNASYTWRIVDSPDWIVSVDARVSHLDLDRKKIEGKKSKGGSKKIESLDIAIGGLKGSIHVYQNLLGDLIHREQLMSKDGSEDIGFKGINSRRLHWHRNAVLALKWSLDGNYLISGGEETVLVLWQLESGRRQDLPHLGAPIESIVVSPAGASYSLRLADNSTMILSTTELRPIFSVTGIQIPSAKMDKGIDMPFMATVDKPVPATRLSQSSRIPACTSSSQPGSLLLAVPSSIPSNPISMTAQNASYLQTFDLASTHQISKQALTRTKVTSLNKGPEMNTIEEPNITHLQTSFDGQWLATIDEWTPPNRDLASLSFNEELTIEEQIFRQEIHIKFWLRNNETKAWELISRIDDPHASRTGNPYERSSILELTSDPSSVGFATLGSDGCVKIWKTTARRRHGLDVRGKDGRSLTSWFCKCTVPLESTELLPKSRLPVAKLAYSRDGSILAGALQSAPTSAIYIVDAYNGEIQSVQTGLFDGPLLGLGIIDKYLVTFSHELCVVDLVKDELQYGINLQSYGLSLEVQVAVSHLAVDVQRGIFAIALPGFSKNPTELRSQLAIFDPGDATPLFHTYVPNTINTLLSTPGRKGFIAIDSAAEVRILAPSQPSHLPPLAGPKDEKAPRLGLGDIFGTDQISRPSDDEPTKNVGLLKPKFDKITREATPEDSPVVVSQERLAEVFDVGPAYALPPIVDLFEQIASLYSGRTAS